jgi:hypothetical protein
MVLATQTKLILFSLFIIFERVHFVDAVLTLKHVFWNSEQNMTLCYLERDLSELTGTGRPFCVSVSFPQ